MAPGLYTWFVVTRIIYLGLEQIQMDNMVEYQFTEKNPK